MYETHIRCEQYSKTEKHRDAVAGEDKKKKDANDILEYLTLLDKHKITNIKFLALNLKRVPQIDPSNEYLCFLLESIEDKRKKIDDLMLLKKEVDELHSTVNKIFPQGSVQEATKVGISTNNQKEPDSYSMAATGGGQYSSFQNHQK